MLSRGVALAKLRRGHAGQDLGWSLGGLISNVAPLCIGCVKATDEEVSGAGTSMTGCAW